MLGLVMMFIAQMAHSAAFITRSLAISRKSLSSSASSSSSSAVAIGTTFEPSLIFQLRMERSLTSRSVGICSIADMDLSFADSLARMAAWCLGMTSSPGISLLSSSSSASSDRFMSSAVSKITSIVFLNFTKLLLSIISSLSNFLASGKYFFLISLVTFFGTKLSRLEGGSSSGSFILRLLSQESSSVSESSSSPSLLFLPLSSSPGS